MPFLVGFMKGPSQCAPSDSEPSEARRRAPEGPRWGNAFSDQSSLRTAIERTYILINMFRFRGQSRKVGSNTGLEERLVHLSQRLCVRQRILGDLREVEAKSSVQLHINQPRRDNPSSQIDRLIWNSELPIESFLAPHNLSRA